MTNSSLELDMFGNNDDDDAPVRQLPPPMERRNSIRGIQTAIMKIDPQLLRSLSSSFSFAPVPAPAPLNTNPAGWVSCPSSPLPLSTSSSTSANGSIPVETSPLSILYNGTVTVVDLPRDKADAIIKLAKEGSVTNGGGLGKKTEVGEKLDEGEPTTTAWIHYLFIKAKGPGVHRRAHIHETCPSHGGSRSSYSSRNVKKGFLRQVHSQDPTTSNLFILSSSMAPQEGLGQPMNFSTKEG